MSNKRVPELQKDPPTCVCALRPILDAHLRPETLPWPFRHK